MKKLSKAHQTELEELRTAVTDAAIAFNEKRQELETFREERLADMTEWAGERSESWQDSEAGMAHETWRQEWEEECCEEADEEPHDYPVEAE